MHSNEAEESVIGALLLDNDLMVELSGLEPRHFYYNGELFGLMKELIDTDTEADIMTVSEAVCRADRSRVSADVMSHLAGMAERSVSLSAVDEYAKIIIEHNKNYRLYSISQELAVKAQSSDESESICTELSSEIESILQDSAEQTITLKDQWRGFLEGLKARAESGDGLVGVTTGFKGLDEITCGVPKGDLVVVAARPSMGKTTFAMNMVKAAVEAQDAPVVVFSLEMPAEQLMQRLVSDIGTIQLNAIRTGKMENDDWSALAAAGNIMTKWMESGGLHIIDISKERPYISTSVIDSVLRGLEREYGSIGMVMVDYIQIVKPADSSVGKVNQVTQISNDLKRLASRYNTPMVALSQLNRSLEQRPDKRPINSDLRDSGAIEQDADIIIFIYRDEIYNEDTMEKGIGEIIIGKQRNGPLGTVKLSFRGQYSRFENYTYDNGYN